AFTNAKYYLDMGLQDDYRAAVMAFDNVLIEFPDTKYAEEMEFLSIKAQYLYASNSLLHRQEERFNEAIEFYNRFASSYPESKFMKEADALRQSAVDGVAQANKRIAEINAAAAERSQGSSNPVAETDNTSVAQP